MKALIVWGGWEGHEPQKVAAIFADSLAKRGFEVDVSDTLDSFKDPAKLKSADLIVPEWTMGSITPEQLNPLLEAVRTGTGIAGVHGGMADSFRLETEYQFMVGGQWVAHPGGLVDYDVEIINRDHEITKGINPEFSINSEQYYMHVDPGTKVLAITRFKDYRNVAMPVAWMKMYGRGRVFYCSLGHVAKDLDCPEALEMILRGMVWAAKGKAEAAS